MVRIRLQRIGKTHQPFYRIVVADSRRKQAGRVKEVVGTYDPRRPDAEAQIQLQPERVQHWLDCGAQVSETVASILAARKMLPERLKGIPGAKK